MYYPVYVGHGLKYSLSESLPFFILEVVMDAIKERRPPEDWFP